MIGLDFTTGTLRALRQIEGKYENEGDSRTGRKRNEEREREARVRV